MRKLSLLLTLPLIILFSCKSEPTQPSTATNKETITISGRVTDFDGNPIDSCMVQLLYAGFKPANTVHTDKEGYYTMPDVKKGRYLAMYMLRVNEYPRQFKVPKDDMRLEFWAWNVIADRDLTVNGRYHRLELYGTNVFKVEHSGAGYMIYTRPMSLQKLISAPDEIIADKVSAAQTEDISVGIEHFEAKVYVDDIPIEIISIQAVKEDIGIPDNPMGAFLIQIAPLSFVPDKPYIMFRIEGLNKEFNERGENIYFYEIKDYKKQPAEQAQ